MESNRPPRRLDAARYDIVVRGELSDRFASAFEQMTVHAADGQTHIVGTIVDQAHLHGLLDRIRDLGIELISVTPIETDACAPGKP